MDRDFLIGLVGGLVAALFAFGVGVKVGITFGDTNSLKECERTAGQIEQQLRISERKVHWYEENCVTSCDAK